jgi:predicted DNA-binding protein (UPF0251 family)
MRDSSNNDDEFGQYISQTEAARIIGISRQSVTNLVRRGYFTAKAAVGRILILRAEAEAFVPRPKGRPTKEASAKKVPVKKPLEILNRGASKEYISQAEGARIRGVSQQAIADLIRRGKLAAVTVGGRTLVLRSEVESFIPQPKVGRPPKKKAKKEPSKKAKARNRLSK